MIGSANGSGRPNGRRRRQLLLPAALGIVAVGGLWLAATATAAPPPHNGKVTLCHATPPASAKNGWVQITVSTNAVTHGGHGNHADDIIPSFTYYVKSAQQTYPGKNLSTMFGAFTGQQILNNGCAVPATVAPVVATKSAAAAAPVAVVTTVPAPSTTTRTVVVHVPAVATRTVSASVTATKLKLAVAAAQASAGVDAVQASASAASSSDVVGLAAGATGDHGTGATDYVALYAAIGGAALAALLGMGGLALWRRQHGVGAQL